MVSGSGPSSRRLPASTKGTSRSHAFVHHAARQASGLDGLGDAAGMIDGVDGAHVIAMAMLFLAAVGLADAERGAEQSRFNIVDAERVAGQQRLHPAAVESARQRRPAAGVDDHGSGDDDDFLPAARGLPHQRGGLADGGFDLPLRRNSVAHEGEGEAVALLRFGHDADAAHAGDHLVALLQIAQAAADGAAVGDHDHGVHALILDFQPFA